MIKPKTKLPWSVVEYEDEDKRPYWKVAQLGTECYIEDVAYCGRDEKDAEFIVAAANQYGGAENEVVGRLEKRMEGLLNQLDEEFKKIHQLRLDNLENQRKAKHWSNQYYKILHYFETKDPKGLREAIA